MAQRISPTAAFVAALAVLFSLSCSLQVAAADFSRDIQPLLAKRCFACHGPDTQEAGLRFDTAASATAELDSGYQAIVPSDVDSSEILSRVTSSDPDLQMPPEGARLTADEVSALRSWIDEGAQWKEHWAFRSLVRPDVPDRSAGSSTGEINPIDVFIQKGLAERSLPVPPTADRRTLLRRATYNVTGLPPSEKEVQDFVADTSPHAWERVVDRLLASPHYGEQWARHWLDLVRYADTNSYERDGNKPHSWRYRDYVIRSFNDDKPFDDFVIEQLAGDEIPEPTAESLIATGYYRLGIWDDEPADKLQHRYDQLDDVVATTAKTFLAMTVDCARCHDHKIDPILQKDYYSLLAFFQNITPMGDRQMNPDFIEQPLPKGEMTPAEAKDIAVDRNRRLQEARGEVKAIQRRIKEFGEQARDELTKKDLKAWHEKIRQLEQEKAELAKMPAALVVTEYGNKSPDTFVLYRGNPHAETSPELLVEPAFPSVLKAAAPVIEPPGNGRSTGRRLALAKWIVSADNPLSARVLANRIWQYHFGRGIVRSPSNFGFAGDPPTHPELLDWLATELVRQDWHIKDLQKTILMSAAYQAASTPNEEAYAQDSRNESFWRFDMRRLSAEELRDSVHVVSGAFNPKMFGPGIYPAIPKEVLATQSKPGKGWGNSSPEEQARRSVYVHVKRSLITPILADFDLADTDTTCPVRFVTTQPTQALGMMNSEFMQQQSKVFAERIAAEAGGPDVADTKSCVRRAIEVALVREPTDDEVQHGLALINELETTEGISPGRSLELYCLFLLNLNEFAYLD